MYRRVGRYRVAVQYFKMSQVHLSSTGAVSLDLRLPNGQRISNSTDPGFSEAKEMDPDLLKQPHSHFETLSLPNRPLPPPAPRFGNPVPISLGGFLLANTPATIMLLGWHGAGGDSGNESASIGAFFFLGGALMYLGGIGEWLQGNTFSAVVDLTLGGYFAASAATLTPFFNSPAAYGNENSYYSSYAMFEIFMGVLLMFYTVAALRTNFCLVAIFACFTVCFPCIAASYFLRADGKIESANFWRKAGAMFSLVGSVIVWYVVSESSLKARSHTSGQNTDRLFRSGSLRYSMPSTSRLSYRWAT